MEGALGEMPGKMGAGVLRYSPNPIACIIDSTHAGRDHREITAIMRPCPIVASITEARNLGAEVFVLGIAPPGGLVPEAWWPAIDQAVSLGMSVINGLHDRVAPRYPGLGAGQWVWDIRVEPKGLSVASGRAAELNNRRVLMIGTDMAVGKMTAGLEIWRFALAAGVNAAFIATGQIGITITGRGVPLDAVRVDYAAHAIEREILGLAHSELILIEGQGALIHPGSTANLPLLRGSMPTHLVLCHRAGMTHLQRLPHIAIPPLREYVALYQELATVLGAFPKPILVAGALNTHGLSEEAARIFLAEFESELGVPCDDPVRFGADRLARAVMTEESERNQT